MESEKKYHQRKLAIIEMIEECERRVKSEVLNMEMFRYLPGPYKNSKDNFNRYQNIKRYLISRY